MSPARGYFQKSNGSFTAKPLSFLGMGIKLGGLICKFQKPSNVPIAARLLIW